MSSFTVAFCVAPVPTAMCRSRCHAVTFAAESVASFVFEDDILGCSSDTDPPRSTSSKCHLENTDVCAAIASRVLILLALLTSETSETGYKMHVLFIFSSISGKPAF